MEITTGNDGGDAVFSYHDTERREYYEGFLYRPGLDEGSDRWIGYFVGGMDGMLIALIVLMSLDYISGIMCAVIDKKLSSAIGFRGICKKVLILMLVGVANIVDLHVVGTGSALRGAVICFYMSNEALSLFENAAHIGLPIPDKLREALAQLHGRDDKDKSDTTDEDGKGDGE